MQELSELIPDPKNWPYAYTWDAQGYFAGMVRRQPDPEAIRTGKGSSFLLPANSTEKRPAFTEGFKPKWDGQNWILENAVSANAKVNMLEAAIKNTSDRIARDLEVNADQLAKVAADREMNSIRAELKIEVAKYLKDVFQSELESLRSEVRRVIDQLEAKKAEVVQLIDSNGNQFLSQVTELKDRAKIMQDETSEKMQLALDAISNSQNKPSLFSRLMGNTDKTQA